MIKYSTLFSMLLVVLVSGSNSNAEQHNQMALINDVTFHYAEFDNNNAGNAFIVNVKGREYAVTAKHILMIVKTDKMNFVDFAGELKQWKMHDKNDASHYLIVDQLLNANTNEKLDWETLKNDWIVFSIKENKTNYQALQFRQKPLVKGEKLYIVGWSYQDKVGPQRTYEYEFDETKGGSHVLKQLTGPESLAGLSGSPVVDKDNKVIGLVSTGWHDEKNTTTYVQASKASEIQNFIEHLPK